MHDLSIPPEDLRRLLEQLRALGSEDDVTVDDGIDLRTQEVTREIEAFDRDQQHQIVALLWLGRGDFDHSDWDEAVALAEERHSGPTARYILSHPLAADEIAIGLEAIGHDHVLLDGKY